MGTEINTFNFNEETKKNSLESFKRTKFCRFKASDRLKSYTIFSNWVFTILSLLLIIASLLDIYKILSTTNFYGFYQVSLAITILVFFQVIANSHYEKRALHFHQCGIEISKLLQKFEYIKVKEAKDSVNKDLDYEDKIKRILNEYSSILKRYENHDEVDYLEYKKHKLEENNKCFLSSLNIKIILLKYILPLSPHIILIILASFGFYKSFNWIICL